MNDFGVSWETSTLLADTVIWSRAGAIASPLGFLVTALSRSHIIALHAFSSPMRVVLYRCGIACEKSGPKSVPTDGFSLPVIRSINRVPTDLVERLTSHKRSRLSIHFALTLYPSPKLGKGFEVARLPLSRVGRRGWRMRVCKGDVLSENPLTTSLLNVNSG